jgi:hypothetical protein
MNSPAQVPTGTAIVKAMRPTSSVPVMRPRTPKLGVSASGRHSTVVKKRWPIAVKASWARSSRNRPTRTISTSTVAPAALVRYPKSRSIRVGSSATSRGVRARRDAGLVPIGRYQSNRSWRSDGCRANAV